MSTEGVGAWIKKIKDLTRVQDSMAKSLGQIHTVNFEFDVTSDGEQFYVDTSGELTQQLQRQIRQASNFKIVGLDMQVSELGGVSDAGGSISGKIRYYTPTKGRCDAYRSAFQAMMDAMRTQGITPGTNEQYDFRVPLRPLSVYSNSDNYVNAATLDGTHELVFTGSTDTNTNILDVHNKSVKPQQTAVPNFSAGYNTLGVQNSPTDFVLNDGIMFAGNEHVAEVGFENIPFQLSYSPGSTDVAFKMEWRPDPALFLSVLTGQFDVFIDEIDLDDGANALKLEIAVMVAGWKSMLKEPTPRSNNRKGRK